MTHAIATNRPHLHLEKCFLVADRVRPVVSRGSNGWGVIFSTAVALIVRPSVHFSKILLNIKQNMRRNLVNCEHDGAEEVLFGASDGRASTTTPSYVSSPFDEQVSTLTIGDFVVLFLVEAFRASGSPLRTRS